MSRRQDRAVFYIDGNNWYHSLLEIGLNNIGGLNYPRICEKLVGPRTWLQTRYYIPDVGIIGDPKLLEAQRAFLAKLRAQDPRITVQIGRLEPRPPDARAGAELLRYLAGLRIRIPKEVYRDLIRLGNSLTSRPVFIEKAVDVQIAVDMVTMAANDEYDTTYLLSADGDFTPAVQAIRRRGKKVFAVSPNAGAKLAAEVDSYIRLKPGWFDSCF